MVRRGLLVLAGLAGLITGASGQGRVPPDPAAKVFAGGYQLQSADGARRCLILLQAPDSAGRRAVGFPPPCRRTLPVLDAVRGWQVEMGAGSPRITLTDAGGAVRLEFTKDHGERGLAGQDGTGAIYHLTPMAGSAPAERARSVAAVQAARAQATVQIAAIDPAAMMAVHGAYVLVRKGGQTTGCQMMLEPAPTGQEGRVRLTPGCDDKGVVFFGPAGWRIAAGTLWLTGPRGKLSFERNRKGGWDKGPGQGEPLSLVRR